MLFLLRSWCYFSSSAVALLVGISKFKHIYEAELQLSTRFPFHCQDCFFSVFILESKFGQTLANMLHKRGCSGALSDPCCLSSPIGFSGFIHASKARGIGAIGFSGFVHASKARGIGAHLLNFKALFEWTVGILLVEDQSDMWTPKNSDFGIFMAPQKPQIWGHFLMQIKWILKMMEQAVHKNQCSFFWGVSASSSTFMKQSYNFLRASRSIAKTGL